MSRKTEIALLATALAIAAPLSSAFAAHPRAQAAPRPAMSDAVATTQAIRPLGTLAANGTAAYERAAHLEAAESTGHGGGGGAD